MLQGLDFLGDTILVVAAHSDDAEISMGGTIAKLVQMKKRVVVAIHALSNPPVERKQEAIRGAAILGAELHLMSEENRQVADVLMKDIVRDIDGLLDLYRPDTVFTHYLGDTHLDHRILTEAVLSSTRRSPFHLIHFEQSALLPVPLEPFLPNFYVDITEQAELKWGAIRAHRSQTNVTSLIDEYRIRASYHGATMKATAAEAFRIARLYG